MGKELANGLPWWLSGKESACKAGVNSPGGGHGNPLQYSCLENPMDRGAWWATVHRVTESEAILAHTLAIRLLISWLCGVKITQSCPTPCNLMDYTVHGILQARILEWVAFPFSRTYSQTRDWTQVSCITGFTNWTIGRPSLGFNYRQLIISWLYLSIIPPHLLLSF